jgi:hypothetical protein
MGEVFQEDQVMEKIQYWDAQREELGFETVWSMWEWSDIDQNILTPGVRRVCYQFYGKDVTVEQLMSGTAGMTEVSAFAASGSVRDLWTAAESCYQQAKLQGDWHYFIEDIVMRDDGSFELTMGS